MTLCQLSSIRFQFQNVMQALQSSWRLILQCFAMFLGYVKISRLASIIADLSIFVFISLDLHGDLRQLPRTLPVGDFPERLDPLHSYEIYQFQSIR
jgi:hypothetical protein